jgi:hypothetical protein
MRLAVSSLAESASATRRCATSEDTMRALPKITIVDSICCSLWISSGLSSSSCMRTGRSSSRSRNWVSRKARRYALSGPS